MIVATSLFVLGPLVLWLCVLELVAALVVLRGSERLRWLIPLGWIGVWTLAILGAFFAILSGHYNQDWVHNFWGAQVPMVGLFLSSGLFLCRVWREDASFIGSGRSNESASNLAGGLSLIHPAWLLLGMLVVLSLIPLGLQLISPSSYANPHSTGRPVSNLVELAHWGLGGPIPGYLAEVQPDGTVRAHQNVPREVTVPMGTTLIAAWLWIMFCVIALLGRIVPRTRFRISVYLVAPVAFGVMWVAGLGGLPLGERLALDPRYFGPESARDSGIWRDEGGTLATYGEVMLLAAILTVVLALALMIDGILWRRRNAAISASTTRAPEQPRTEERGPTRISLRAGLAWLAGRSVT